MGYGYDGIQRTQALRERAVPAAVAPVQHEATEGPPGILAMIRGLAPRRSSVSAVLSNMP